MAAPALVGGLVRVNVTNFTNTGNQFFPHATALADGRIAIGWNTDNGYQVAVMKTDGVTETAQATWAFTVGTMGPSDALAQIDLTQLSDGRLVAAWINNGVDASGDVNWAYLDPFIGYQGAINTVTTSGTNKDVVVAAGTFGRFLMVDTRDGTGLDVSRVISVNSVGGNMLVAGELTQGSAVTAEQSQPNIVGLSDGRFVAVWYDFNDNTVKGEILLSDGSRNGIFTVGTGAQSSSHQDNVMGLTALANGGFAVSWNAGSYRFFDAAGTPTTAQLSLSGYSFGTAMATLKDGRVVFIAANSSGDVSGQLINADGTLNGAQFTVGNLVDTENQVDVVALADGRFAVTYSQNNVAGGNSRDIVMKVFDPREAALNGVSASNGADTWYGTAFADFVLMGAGNDTFNAGAGVDFIYGEDGNDTLNGGDGGDTLIGGNGNDTLNGDANDDALHGDGGDDTLNGGDGDDILYGGAGADALNGGNGFDYASYLTSSGGVTANLATPASNVGDAIGDTYVSIEGLIGSSFADILKGDGNDNWIYGGDGFDQIYGGAGNDVLIAGNGSDDLYGGAGADALYGEGGTADWARYDDAAAGLVADLASPAGNTGDAAGDTYNGIEGLVGSAFNDILRGDSGANQLLGNAGADTLIGRDGNDSLSGGAGNDILNGGAGADSLNGGTEFDYATYADHLGGLTADLQTAANNTGEATGDTYTSVEGLIGTAFDDSLRGDAGDNWIYGGNGNDFIYGRDGADTLLGEAGNDTIYGGAGNDAIYGGLGNDTLVFAAGDGKDIFYDFVGGAGASDSVLISTALGVSNYAQLQTKMVQVGADVVITFDASTSITLIGTNLAALSADDFGFY